MHPVFEARPDAHHVLAAGIRQALNQVEARAQRVQVLRRVEVLARLRVPRRVDASLRPDALEQPLDGEAIGQVALQNLDAFDDPVQPLARGACANEDRDVRARGDQAPYHVRADETSGSSDEYGHRSLTDQS